METGYLLRPISYRRFIAKGLTKWQPWYFIDTIETIGCEPELSTNDFFHQVFKKETGADFDVYLFARKAGPRGFRLFCC